MKNLSMLKFPLITATCRTVWLSAFLLVRSQLVHLESWELNYIHVALMYFPVKRSVPINISTHWVKVFLHSRVSGTSQCPHVPSWQHSEEGCISSHPNMMDCRLAYQMQITKLSSIVKRSSTILTWNIGITALIRDEKFEMSIFHC